MIPKRWGTQYPISTDQRPATVVLHQRFEEQLTTYLAVNATEDPSGTTFQRFFETATVQYRDAPVHQIRWMEGNTTQRVGDGAEVQKNTEKESVLAEEVLQRSYKETEDSTQERN